MATSWVLGKISNALQPTIQSTVSTAGSYAGGALSSVGSGINGVGETINGTIKRYGDGVRDYGNGVMDWTNATGTRSQTASNPLGLNSGSTGGKRSVTSPSVYSAPQKPKPSVPKAVTTANKTVQPQKKIAGAPVKKALPAPTTKTSIVQPRKTTVAASAKPTVASKGTSSVVSRPAGTPAAKPVVRPTTVTKPIGGMKPSTATVTKAKPSSVGKSGQVGGSNPLGLSF